MSEMAYFFAIPQLQALGYQNLRSMKDRELYKKKKYTIDQGD